VASTYSHEHLPWQQTLPEDVRYGLAQRHLRRSEDYLDNAAQAVDDKVRNAWWRMSIQEELLALEFMPVEHSGQVPLPGEEWDDGDEDCEVEPYIECVICGGPAPAPTRGNPIEGLYCERCK
jgi:hypothetical protein